MTSRSDDAIWQGRPSWRAQAGLVAIGVATLPLLGVGLLALLVAFDRVRRKRYVLTGDRVLREDDRGGLLFDPASRAIPLGAVRSVRVEQGPVAERLGVGTVVVEADDGTTLRIDRVADPGGVRDRILAARG